MIETLSRFSPQIFKALGETFLLVGIASIFALVFGMLLGITLYTCRPNGDFPNKIIYWLGNTYVNVVRSIPFLIFIVILFPLTRFLIGKTLGTIPATFPLSLISIALYSRFVEQSLLEVPQAVQLTAKSLGSTFTQSLRYFMLPYARQGLILGFTSTIISTLSYSTVVGVVGGGGIGDFAFRYGYQSYNFVLMYFIVLIIVILVQLIQAVGNYLSTPKHLK